MKRLMLLFLLLAGVAILPARGDSFSGGSGGVTWPLSVTTGGGAVAQIVGPSDQNLSITSGVSGATARAIVIAPADAGTSTSGAALSLTAGASTSLSGGAGGGAASLTGGSAAGTSAGGAPIGGSASVVGGASGTHSSGTGGAANLTGGVSNGSSGTAGPAKVTGGAGNVSGAAGGAAQVIGGAGNGAGAGGTVTLTPGVSASGTDGSLILQGTSSHAASTVLTVAGTTATAAGTWAFSGATVTGVYPKYNCEAYFAANFTLTSGTDTSLTWDTETYDNGACHDTSSNKERFTAPASGLYHFDCYFFVAPNGTGTRNVQGFKNTSVNSFIYNSTTADITSVGREMELHFSVQLTAGDYIKFTCYQNSGGNLNLLGGATDGSGTNASLTSRVQMSLLAAQ